MGWPVLAGLLNGAQALITHYETSQKHSHALTRKKMDFTNP
jgi:uncharacterized membrane protein